jgi:Zn-dependent peptidase ImmA (M78 family)
LQAYFTSLGELLAPPIPVFEIAEWLGVRHVVIDRFNERQPNWSGAIRLRDGVVTMWTRGKDHQHHQRFTAAHELGHLLSGHVSEEEPEFRDNFRPMPPGDPRRLFERQANNYSAELLMPEVAVLEAGYRFGISNVSRLATEFRVSTVAMGYRLKNLGFA